MIYKHTLLTIITWSIVIAVVLQTQFGIVIMCIIATAFFVGETIGDAIKLDLKMKEMKHKYKHKHKQILGL